MDRLEHLQGEPAVCGAAAMAVSAGQSERWRDLALGALMRSAPEGASRKTHR